MHKNCSNVNKNMYKQAKVNRQNSLSVAFQNSAKLIWGNMPTSNEKDSSW